MLHPNLQIAIRVALSIIGVRLVLFYGGFEAGWTEPAYLFLNLAALPALSIYAIWPRGSYPGFLTDAKASMQQCGLYALIMGLFFYLYYANIDTEFFPSMHERITFQEIENTGEGAKPEQIAEKVRSFFSLRNGTAIVLALYVALSAFYSILFAAIKRAIPTNR